MLKRATSIVLGATAVSVTLLVAIKSVVATMPDSQEFDQIERGRYLVTAGDCITCHKPASLSG
jgi:hypothetical protein